MEWKSNLITGLQWSDRIINREGKERIARELAAQVKDGEVIGAGSGSTVYLTLFAIAERIRTEKLQVRVIPASAFILVDNSKFVSRLGSKFPVPVEVFPTGVVYVENQLKTLGASKVVLRMAKGKDGPILTENGNFILDAWFDGIGNFLEKEIKSITGVIESGLFIGYDIQVLAS